MTPVRAIGDLRRDELAVLARELLLAGQLMDRAGMPHLISNYGREEMGAIAIDEWMGASPVYTRRTQRLLGFEGDTIDTMFKGLQLDIGAPPEFMDFRLRVIDDHHGEFWLDHCGALMDVEPMGDDYVITMCHAIEDPTFDATAMATSPYARIRPVHRPPRAPHRAHGGFSSLPRQQQLVEGFLQMHKIQARRRHRRHAPEERFTGLVVDDGLGRQDGVQDVI